MELVRCSKGCSPTGPLTQEHALTVPPDLDRVSAIRMGPPHEDVAGALAHGTDGDRSLLDSPIVPVV